VHRCLFWYIWWQQSEATLRQNWIGWLTVLQRARSYSHRSYTVFIQDSTRWVTLFWFYRCYKVSWHGFTLDFSCSSFMGQWFSLKVDPQWVCIVVYKTGQQRLPITWFLDDGERNGSETLDFCSVLMQLVTQENFVTYSHCENFFSTLQYATITLSFTLSNSPVLAIC
jgi:hypothetical protein